MISRKHALTTSRQIFRKLRRFFLIVELDFRISKILRKARRSRNESTDIVARALSLQESEVRRLERRPVKSPMCMVVKVADYYGTSTRCELEMTMFETMVRFQLRSWRFGVKHPELKLV